MNRLRDLILGMDKKIDVFIAQNIEQLKRIEQRIDSVESNLTQKIDALDKKVDSIETRMNAQDTRIWSIVVGVVLALFGLLAKVAFFPDVKI
jgi:hypothetical protein